MISVEGLKVEFGVKPLFHDVSFVINDRDRIALVGKNGAGKSTMLKILCGCISTKRAAWTSMTARPSPGPWTPFWTRRTRFPAATILRSAPRDWSGR